MNILTISLTNKCPLKCSHCGPESGPNEKGELEKSLAIKAIEDAFKEGCEIVNISGGEPFVMKGQLLDYLKSIKENFMVSRITTGGFWAKSIEKAKSVLDSMSQYLDELVISVSNSHLQFLSIDNAINAIVASRYFGITPYLSIEKEKDKKLIRILSKRLTDKNITVPFFIEVPIVPFGRAKTEIPKSQLLLKNMDSINGPCPSINRNLWVHSNGVVTACTSVFANECDSLKIGNVKDNSIRDLIHENVTKNALHKWIEYYGHQELRRIIEEKFNIKFPSEYVNICHLCGEIMSNKDYIKYLKKILSIK